MEDESVLKKFFFPKMTKAFLARAVFVALSSCLFFSFVVIPMRLKGASMEPTLRDGSFHFIFAQAYLFSRPQKGDVVGIRLAGRRVLLLKRIVAVEGEKVAFMDGILFVDAVPVSEPYIVGKCDWNYDEKPVEEGKVFVVGDNRLVPMESHDFGEVSKSRIAGRLIW